MSKPLAYSYIRFSTPEQAKGDSLRRQVENAERYAHENSLSLSSLTLEDLGTSAYRGKNIADGDLGYFRKAVEEGDIPEGSYLLIESPDRLSRLPAVDALEALTAICKLGIIVVTLDDGQAYDITRLRDEFHTLLKWLLRAEVSHDESRKKAQRVAEAWGNKRKGASPASPITSICPNWLTIRLDENGNRVGFDLIENRVDVVKRIFDYTLAGMGQHKITELLNAENVPPFGKAKFWHRSYIKKILENPSVIGTYQPHKIEHHGKNADIKRRVPDGGPIKDYFPSIIRPIDFETIRTTRSGKKFARSSQSLSTIKNVLAGLAKCSSCGSTMTRISKGSRSKPYLVCTAAKTGHCTQGYKSLRLDLVEDGLMKSGGDWVHQAPHGSEAGRKRLADAEAIMYGIEEAMMNLLNEIKSGGSSPLLREELDILEDSLRDQRKAVDEMSRTLADKSPSLIKRRLAKLLEALANGDSDIVGLNSALRICLETVTVDCGDAEDMRVPSLTFNWHQGGETGILLGGFGRVN